MIRVVPSVPKDKAISPPKPQGQTSEDVLDFIPVAYQVNPDYVQNQTCNFGFWDPAVSRAKAV
jgi:hypothetical protein